MAAVRAAGLLGLLLFGQGVLSVDLEPTPTEHNDVLVARASAAAPDVTEVTDCHLHGDTLYVLSRPFSPDYRAPVSVERH